MPASRTSQTVRLGSLYGRLHSTSACTCICKLSIGSLWDGIINYILLKLEPLCTILPVPSLMYLIAVNDMHKLNGVVLSYPYSVFTNGLLSVFSTCMNVMWIVLVRWFIFRIHCIQRQHLFIWFIFHYFSSVWKWKHNSRSRYYLILPRA